MPLFIKEFQWEQSTQNIFIKIPLKGAKKTGVNVLQSEDYIKVSFPPYLFEQALFGKISHDNTILKISDGFINLKLDKVETVDWPELSRDLPIDQSERKTLLMNLRQEAVEFSIKDTEQKREARVADKNKKDRFSVSQQIKLEQEEKKRIEDYKNSEKKKVADEILEFQKVSNSESKENEMTDELKRQWEHYNKLEAELKDLDSDEDEMKAVEETKKEMKAENAKLAEIDDQITTEKYHKAPQPKPDYYKQKQIFENDEISQPAIRGQEQSISISFTPRVFPTPLRESRKPEEDEWLRKQAEARQRSDIDTKELTEAEKDPILLRQKGNSFFQQGNYQSAVNVFTHAIKLYPKMPELLSNRAACHLKLRNFFKALDDSSKALDLLVPAVEANAKDRMKAHMRRGVAFCELECYAEGLVEYEAALKCDPNNEQIKSDCEKLRSYIQGSYTGELLHNNPQGYSKGFGRSERSEVDEDNDDGSSSESSDEEEIETEETRTVLNDIGKDENKENLQLANLEQRNPLSTVARPSTENSDDEIDSDDAPE